MALAVIALVVLCIMVWGWIMRETVRGSAAYDHPVTLTAWMGLGAAAGAAERMLEHLDGRWERR